MSDNRRTLDAEPDLEWYFGNADQTASGDLGLRGIDYAALAQAIAGSGQPDSGAAEDRALRAGDAVRRWRRVHARVSRVGARHAEVLWMAYGQAVIRPHVPAHARLTQAAVRGAKAASEVKGRKPTWIEIDTWLAKAPRQALVPVIDEAKTMLRAALMAYAKTGERSESERT
jgi:hypothetical protein